MQANKTTGFTLIELMIAVVIVGILTAIAYPSYTNYVLRGKRVEGRAFLMDAAALQERYYSDCNKYGILTGTRSCQNSIAGINTESENNLYSLTISMTGNKQKYTMTATPSFDDDKCTTLTISETGKRGYTGSGSKKDCWAR